MACSATHLVANLHDRVAQAQLRAHLADAVKRILGNHRLCERKNRGDVDVRSQAIVSVCALVHFNLRNKQKQMWCSR